MPTVNPYMYAYNIKYAQQVEIARNTVSTIRNYIEPLASAMNRDRSHPTHGPLVDVISENNRRSHTKELLLEKER